MGRSWQEHLSIPDDALGRLEAAGFRLKTSKCVYLAPALEYLGPCDFYWGLMSIRREGTGHLWGTKSNQHQPAEVISGDDCLLHQVHPKSGQYAVTSLFALEKGQALEVGKCSERSIWEGQECTRINSSPGALCSWERTYLGLWRISIWDWRCPLSSGGKWDTAQTICFCKPHIGSSWKELFSVGERMPGTSVWSEEIQPVTPWQTIHYPIGPQATGGHLSQFSAAAIHVDCLNPEMSSHIRRLWLPGGL